MSDQPTLPVRAFENAATLRRRRFALEYVIDLNGRAAAVRAGYARGKADGRASELIRRPDVQAMIRDELAAREARTQVDGDRVIRELARIAFADPSRVAHWGPDGVTLRDSDDMTEDDKAAVKWISVGGRKGANAQRFEMHDKVGALDILARLTGLMTRQAGKGRFAMLGPSQEEREAQKAQAAATFAKLQKLMDAKAAYMAQQMFDTMKAADARGEPASVDAAFAKLKEHHPHWYPEVREKAETENGA